MSRPVIRLAAQDNIGVSAPPSAFLTGLFIARNARISASFRGNWGHGLSPKRCRMPVMHPTMPPNCVDCGGTMVTIQRQRETLNGRFLRVWRAPRGNLIQENGAPRRTKAMNMNRRFYYPRAAI
jgi:hypothetical protein